MDAVASSRDTGTLDPSSSNGGVAAVESSGPSACGLGGNALSGSLDSAAPKDDESSGVLLSSDKVASTGPEATSAEARLQYWRYDLVRNIPEDCASRIPPWLVAAVAANDGQACPVYPIVASPDVTGYRNKASFTVGFDAEGKVRSCAVDELPVFHDATSLRLFHAVILLFDFGVLLALTVHCDSDSEHCIMILALLFPVASQIILCCSSFNSLFDSLASAADLLVLLRAVWLLVQMVQCTFQMLSLTLPLLQMSSS